MKPSHLLAAGLAAIAATAPADSPAPELKLLLTNSSSNRLRSLTINESGGVYAVRSDTQVLYQDGTSTETINAVYAALLNSRQPLTPTFDGDFVLVAGRNSSTSDSSFVVLSPDGTLGDPLTPALLPTPDLTFSDVTALSIPSGGGARTDQDFAQFFLDTFIGPITSPSETTRRYAVRAYRPDDPSGGSVEVTESPGAQVPSPDVLINSRDNVTKTVESSTNATTRTVVISTMSPPELTNVANDTAAGLLRSTQVVEVTRPADPQTTPTVVTTPAVADRIFYLPLPARGASGSGVQLVEWNDAVPGAASASDGSRLYYLRGQQNNFSSAFLAVQNPEETGSAPPADVCLRGDLDGNGVTNGQDLDEFLDALLKKLPAADLNQDGKVNDKDAKLFFKCINSGASRTDAAATECYSIFAANRPVPGVADRTTDFVLRLRGNGSGAMFIAVQARIPGSFDTEKILLRYDDDGFGESMRTGVDYGHGLVEDFLGYSNVNQSGQMAILTRLDSGFFGLYTVQAENLSPDPPPATPGEHWTID